MGAEGQSAGAVERERAERSYRGFVRGAGIGVSFAIAGIFAIDSFLPATTSTERIGLLIGAALVIASGTIWFGVVPRSWFGSARIFSATIIATLVILVMIQLTGGPQSRYVGYLIVPAIVLILAGSAIQMAYLAALVFGAIVVMALSAAVTGQPLPDTAPSRFLLLATVLGACAAIAYATGKQRVNTMERAAGLADESAAARSLAMTDALTGLGNRRALEAHLSRTASDAQRTGVPFSVIALDIDGLKRVNDQAGHDAGDALLKDFARAIDDAIRGSDVGLRVGGDEFVLILPRTSEMSAKTVAERVMTATEQYATPFGPPRFSYGIATYVQGENEYDVMTRADAALNAVKRARGGRSA